MIQIPFILVFLWALLLPNVKSDEYRIGKSRFHVPARAITKPPGHHWFGYYDKLEFDPSGRYVLSNQVDFEGRSPTAGDTIDVGMVDLSDGDRWIPLGTSTAWGWQQGCMLQFIPGSANEVIWNDKGKDGFICHIKNIETGVSKTWPFPVYTLSPDGKTALSVDFERINDLRKGYGYAGKTDPFYRELAPENSGIYLCNLETGRKKLIISLKRMYDHPLPESDDPKFLEFKDQKHWFNHLLFNTDGSRFVFLHRWRTPASASVGGFGTLMYSSDLEGKDIRIVDGSGYTSHFIWRDTDHLMMWTRHQGQPGFFLFKDDGSDKATQVGRDVMTLNGHNTYLPGNDWVLNDTYPDGARFQHVYLYHIPTKRRIPIADTFLDPVYKGEWRVDTHPRSSPDGTKIVIDCPVEDQGRQLILMDIGSVIK